MQLRGALVVGLWLVGVGACARTDLRALDRGDMPDSDVPIADDDVVDIPPHIVDLTGAPGATGATPRLAVSGNMLVLGVRNGGVLSVATFRESDGWTTLPELTLSDPSDYAVTATADARVYVVVQEANVTTLYALISAGWDATVLPLISEITSPDTFEYRDVAVKMRWDANGVPYVQRSTVKTVVPPATTFFHTIATEEVISRGGTEWVVGDRVDFGSNGDDPSAGYSTTEITITPVTGAGVFRTVRVDELSLVQDATATEARHAAVPGLTYVATTARPDNTVLLAIGATAGLTIEQSTPLTPGVAMTAAMWSPFSPPLASDTTVGVQLAMADTVPVIAYAAPAAGAAVHLQRWDGSAWASFDLLGTDVISEAGVTAVQPQLAASAALVCVAYSTQVAPTVRVTCLAIE